MSQETSLSILELQAASMGYLRKTAIASEFAKAYGPFRSQIITIPIPTTTLEISRQEIEEHIILKQAERIVTKGLESYYLVLSTMTLLDLITSNFRTAMTSTMTQDEWNALLASSEAKPTSTIQP